MKRRISPSLNDKRTRKMLSLKMKLDVIRRCERGERPVDIARSLNLTESTLRTIRLNAEKIKASCKNLTPESVTQLSRSRSTLMERMEHQLIEWIEACNQRDVPLNIIAVQEKAKCLYEKLKLEHGETSAKPFIASHGWFDRFKNRNNLVNLKLYDDSARITRIALNSNPTAKNLIDLKPSGDTIKITTVATNSNSIANTNSPSFQNNDNGKSVERNNDIPKFLKFMTDMVEDRDESDSDMLSTRMTVINEPVVAAEPRGIIDDNQIGGGGEIRIDDGENSYVSATENILSIERISAAFGLIEKALEIFDRDDPDKARSSRVARSIDASLSDYKQIYDEKLAALTRLSVDRFIRDAKPTSSTALMHHKSDSSEISAIQKINEKQFSSSKLSNPLSINGHKGHTNINNRSGHDFIQQNSSLVHESIDSSFQKLSKRLLTSTQPLLKY